MKTLLKLSYYFILLLHIFFAVSCNHKHTLFHKVPSDYSGIHFNNSILENDTLNPLDITNIYNGGGVGIGDLNGDGLQDIYFTGNVVSNIFYLNKGNLKFEDITEQANVNGEKKWCRGITVIDINNDGRLDMYIRLNLIYISEPTRRTPI